LNNGVMSVRDSTVSGNTVSPNLSGGSGIVNYGLLTLSNITVSGNVVSSGLMGAAVANIRSPSTIGTTDISSSTIAYNSALGLAGGISNDSGTVTIRNTIVANNGAGGNCVGTIIDGGTNLQFPGTTCGAGITAADPTLGSLADNGGPTRTHALSSISTAAIDRATTGCPPPAADQRGVPRPQGLACDIGSFEFQGLPMTPTPTPAAAVPTLSSSKLVLFGLALLGVAFLLLRK